MTQHQKTSKRHREARDQGPGARDQGRQGDKEAILHSDFELRNYQRHDYQNLRRGEP